MAEKRQESGFTVTDRRLFTEDGELRKDAPEEREAPKSAAPPASVPPAKDTAPTSSSVAPFPAQGDGVAGQEMPPAPTAAEQQAQADAYRESAKDLDSRVELRKVVWPSREETQNLTTVVIVVAVSVEGILAGLQVLREIPKRLDERLLPRRRKEAVRRSVCHERTVCLCGPAVQRNCSRTAAGERRPAASPSTHPASTILAIPR